MQNEIARHKVTTQALHKSEEEEHRLRLKARQNKLDETEFISRLAFGIAKEFNNKLSVILGYTEMALDQVHPEQPLFKDLKEIYKAAESSAVLVNQLMTFAGKQAISPVAMNINDSVKMMLKMLRELVGESIYIVWLPCSNIWQVKFDLSQLDQILVHMCRNSMDAINGSGRIIIETGNVSLDKVSSLYFKDALPGDYVALALSDNGSGMDKETQIKVFEPFFTTKEFGGGSGMGLPCIYGIVKQHKGFINVFSEPGKGTTFTIYLPRYSETQEQMEKMKGTQKVCLGNETILVVDDDPAILNICKIMLKKLGYNVMASTRPCKAIRMASENTDDLHLLITDILMPDMDGEDLVEKIMSIYPKTRFLLMSGSPSNIKLESGGFDKKKNFIQKPFSKNEFAEKVRDVLDGV
ncbi:MAG: response regulator [Desulfamplus sp.]|nr:response regulator [Desulfamplus sp.]